MVVCVTTDKLRNSELIKTIFKGGSGKIFKNVIRF